VAEAKNDSNDMNLKTALMGILAAILAFWCSFFWMPMVYARIMIFLLGLCSLLHSLNFFFLRSRKIDQTLGSVIRTLIIVYTTLMLADYLQHTISFFDWGWGKQW